MYWITHRRHRVTEGEETRVGRAGGRAGRRAGRQAGRQAKRRADKQTDRQTDKQTRFTPSTLSFTLALIH